MSFGRNPHVAKAQAAEQKARDAKDEAARSLAWREAARQWDRAAEREDNDKRRQEYFGHAETARAKADGTASEDEEEPAVADRPAHEPAPADEETTPGVPLRWMN